ncbi:monooxygenase [Blastococcus xanthinilyticus]|uniref:Antibiotic biosynthesis monooxygenase n=1 Tax=Blastococcus xanthinilyticus TaxID=1564164 RepID=A0A5S5CY71_9ACTN|nr:monooxygenase [Blastococcus xanthinilyticus]TYP87502.1 hypothetical protein BD833_10690 [Blastococcus xanthinilyticus]
MRSDQPSFPDVRRPDSGIVLVSPRYVATADRQRAAAAEAVAPYRDNSPPPGFLALTAFGSTDGQTLLTYAQWAGDDDYRRFDGSHAPGAGTGRAQPIRFVPYRSAVHAPGSVPGLVVAPTFDVDGPERQRTSIDALVDGPLSEPVPGLIASHFHVSLDGSRVLNWAEWVDEHAYDEFMRSARPARFLDAITMPGVRGIGGKRYAPLDWVGA